MHKVSNNGPINVQNPQTPPNRVMNGTHTRANDVAENRFQNSPDAPHDGRWHRFVLFFLVIAASIRQSLVNLIVLLSRRSITVQNPSAPQAPVNESASIDPLKIPPSSNTQTQPPVSSSSSPLRGNIKELSLPAAASGELALTEAEQKEVMGRWNSAVDDLNAKAELIKQKLLPNTFQEWLVLHRLVENSLGQLQAMRLEYTGLNATLNETLQRHLPDNLRDIFDGTSPLVTTLRNANSAVLERIKNKDNNDNTHKHIEFLYKNLMTRIKEQPKVSETDAKEIDETALKVKQGDSEEVQGLKIEVKKLKDNCKQFLINLNQTKQQFQQNEIESKEIDEKELKALPEDTKEVQMLKMQSVQLKNKMKMLIEVQKLKEDCKRFFIDLRDLEGIEGIKRERLASYNRNLGVELLLLEYRLNNINMELETFSQLLEWAPPLRMDKDGMPNLHNTCYINSAIQILHRSGMLREILQRNLERSAGETDADFGKRQEVKNILLRVINELNKSEKADQQALTNALYDFRRAFCDSCADQVFRADDYSGYTSQQDGPSFLKLFLQMFDVRFEIDTVFSQGEVVSNAEPGIRGDIPINVPFSVNRYSQAEFEPWKLQDLINETFSQQIINDPANRWNGFTVYASQVTVRPINAQNDRSPPKYIPISLQRVQQMNPVERGLFVTAMNLEKLVEQLYRDNGGDLNVGTYLDYCEMAEQRLGFSPLGLVPKPKQNEKDQTVLIPVNNRISQRMRLIATQWDNNAVRARAESEFKATAEQVQAADRYNRKFEELNALYHFELNTKEGQKEAQEIVFPSVEPAINEKDKDIVLRLSDLIREITSRPSFRRENFARLRQEAMKELRIIGKRKVLDPIDCSLGQTVDCRKIFAADRPVYYRIKAFQVHHGLTPTGGHYTGVAMHNGHWTHFNDNIVERPENAAIMASGDSRTMYGNAQVDSSDASADYLILERVDEADEKMRSAQS